MKPSTKIIFVVVLVLSPSVVDGVIPEESGFETEWSDPINLGLVNSSSNEQNAFLVKDGLTLYFTSDRPGGHGALDIYVAHRLSNDSPWTTPVNLGPGVNTDSLDFGPAVSIDRHLLFFASTRNGGHGGADIYVARRSDPNDDFAWGTPANVGAPINTSEFEQAPFYLQNTEDGMANLYFNRGFQPAQQADIYYAGVSRKGAAIGGEVFVAELNSTVNDFAVTIRKDGRETFFTSPRPGSLGISDIWTSTRDSVHHPWRTPVNAGVPLSSAFADLTPNLSFDGQTLIFATNRPGGAGGNDLWMSTRR